MLFEDKAIQKEYEERRDKLIKKYGKGCERVRVTPLLIESKLDNVKPQLIMNLLFETYTREPDVFEFDNEKIGYFNEELEDTEDPSELIELK